jgi:hypothetical protein
MLTPELKGGLHQLSLNVAHAMAPRLRSMRDLIQGLDRQHSLSVDDVSFVLEVAGAMPGEEAEVPEDVILGEWGNFEAQRILLRAITMTCPRSLNFVRSLPVPRGSDFRIGSVRR